MAQRPTPKPLNDWETVSGGDDWETVPASTPPKPQANPGSIEAAPSYATQLYREGKAKLGDLATDAKNFFSGIGSGVANTGLGASGLINRATGGRLGVSPSVTLEDIGATPHGKAGQVGMGLEQMSEFFLPEAGIAKAGKLAGGGRLANMALRSAMEAGSAAGISALHGEDPTLPAIAGAAGPVIGNVAESYAPGIYRRALKPSTTYAPEKIEQMVGTGLKEEIPVSGGGRRKLGSLVDSLNAKVRGMLDPAVTINPSDIANRAAPGIDRYGKFAQVNPEADVNTFQNSIDEFLRQHQTPEVPSKHILDANGNLVKSPAVPPQDIPIPSDLAQDIKTGTYRQMNWKKGTPTQLPPAAEAAQKALARGAKEELEVAYPGIREINAREGRALNLDEALGRAVNRIENRDAFGIGAPIMMDAAHAIGGGPGAALGALKLLPPAVTSRLAIEMAKAPTRALGPFGAALAAAASRNKRPIR